MVYMVSSRWGRICQGFFLPFARRNRPINAIAKVFLRNGYRRGKGLKRVLRECNDVKITFVNHVESIPLYQNREMFDCSWRRYFLRSFPAVPWSSKTRPPTEYVSCLPHIRMASSKRAYYSHSLWYPLTRICRRFLSGLRYWTTCGLRVSKQTPSAIGRPGAIFVRRCSPWYPSNSGPTTTPAIADEAQESPELAAGFSDPHSIY